MAASHKMFQRALPFYREIVAGCRCQSLDLSPLEGYAYPNQTHSMFLCPEETNPGFPLKSDKKIISGDGGSQSRANKSVMEVCWCANCPYDRFPSSGCLSCQRSRAVTVPAVQLMDTSVTVLRSGCVTEDRAERETCFHLRAKWRGPAAAGPATRESREEAPRLTGEQNNVFFFSG